MKITAEQKAFLTTLRCERLSTHESNLRLVDSFENSVNQNLETMLKGEAYEQDQESQIAYYLIKNSEGDILFYFSLKCGLLYDSSREWENLSKLRVIYESLVNLNAEATEEEQKTIAGILESIRSQQGIKKEDLWKLKRYAKNDIIEELQRETADHLKRVGKTFAGIEIVHFCVNEGMRDYWSSCPIQGKMGVVVFWNFLVPIVLDIMKLVGCQYLFLFAADLTPDEILVNYYKSFLGFEDTASHSTAISLYDFACKFLYQETKDLAVRREKFFDNFNPDEDMV